MNSNFQTQTRVNFRTVSPFDVVHSINSIFNLFIEARFDSDNLRAECVLFVRIQIDNGTGGRWLGGFDFITDQRHLKR